MERIVAVGDVHGDYEQFVKLLRGAGLLDEKDNWAGGKAHLVQTGDVPDRGPRSRDVMDLLMKLEKQAKKAGGYVHALIGNHEAMNMYGDLRYVHVGEFAAFKTKGSKALRDNFYRQNVKELRQNQPRGQSPEFGPDHKRRWEENFELGWFEHRLGFGARGKYGRWITRHNAVVKINATLFLHGGDRAELRLDEPSGVERYDPQRTERSERRPRRYGGRQRRAALVPRLRAP